MKTLLTGLIIALFSLNTFAQKSPIKFGDIPLEDLKMERYDKDSSAAAVILTDYGSSTINYNEASGFTLTFERVVRIKILTKDGMDWASFTVPLYHSGSDDEKLQSLKGVTYNLENNKIVESKLKNDAIFKEKASENVNYVKFTLPNARQGSIVEVSYSVLSDFLFHFQDWEFQSTIPTRWTEYRANIPEFFSYESYTQGYVSMVINEHTTTSNSITFRNTDRNAVTGTSNTTFDKLDYKETRQRWAAKYVPAFKTEPFMTTSKDYISKIKFELAYEKFPNQPIKPMMGTWEDINRVYNESESFGREVTGNGFLRNIVEGVVAGQTTPEGKISAINTYVKQNVEWNGNSRTSTDLSFKKVLETKKGSSAEINLLLASMLEKAGIEVSPVLISTRDHGFVRQTAPVSSQFNYVLCLAKAGDKSYLLDGTDRFLAMGVLPERCLNAVGFVVSPKGYYWTPLKSSIKSRSVYSADLALSSDGNLTGKLTLDKSGYYAHKGRKSYFSKGEGEYVKDFVGSRSWTVNKSEFVNSKDISAPFKEVHEVVINDHAVAADPMIYVNPFLGMNITENPFKNEKREYPVDFGSPSEMVYMCKIKIPEGYAIEGMPQSKLIALSQNAAKYTYNISQQEGLISITSQLQINSSLFSQEEYPHLREFYNQVVALQSEQIVLKKK
ncbi:MAG: transglutaminase domain-containing protein [Chryseolinea sp.]